MHDASSDNGSGGGGPKGDDSPPMSTSERQLRLIADHTPALMSYVDTEYRYRFVNQQYEQWHGARREEILGRSVRDVLGADAFDGIRELVDRALSGEKVTYERDFDFKGVGRRWTIVNYVPDFDPTGKVNGFFTLIHDITDRRMLEQQLRQAQKLEGIGRVTRDIAHNFNNLLMGVAGCLDVALGRMHGHAARQLVEDARNAALRGTSLTRSMLAFARCNEARLQPVDVDAEIARAEQTLRQLVGDNIDLAVELTAPAIRVQAAEGVIEQVLLNLLTNSRDAMPDGGLIQIETTELTIDKTRDRVSASVKPGHYIAVTVGDNGLGMDEATLNRAMEPFFTTKGLDKATGLGLATVYGAVAEMAGFVDIASQPGKGTTVAIYLPVLSDKDTTVTDKAALGSRSTVLLVEDDDFVRMVLRLHLLDLGYRPLEAAGPTRALEICSEHSGPIDVLLTDILMPGMGGRQLAHQIQQRRPSIKVIGMSARTFDSLQRDGELDPNFPAILEKPFTKEMLGNKLRDTLQQRSTGQ